MYISLSINKDGNLCMVDFDDISKKIVREKKGKSIIDFPSDYVVIDIETTGLDSYYCEIIEIAAIKYSSGQKIDSFSTLIKSKEPLDEFITKLTGITNEMLENAPSISESILEFYNFVGNNILIGYNVNFDINFLYDNLISFHSLALSNPFIDIMRIARKVLPDLKNHKQKTVARHYGISIDGAHRAFTDCEICNSCFLALQSDIILNNNTLEEFKTNFKRNYLHAKDISTSNTYFDTSHPLYEKVCVFTGVLEKMKRKDAMQLVVDLGGFVNDMVTKKTNYLILGNNDFCTSIKDGKSSKYKRAEELILKGTDLEILSESVFYDLVLNT